MEMSGSLSGRRSGSLGIRILYVKKHRRSIN
jgi:hypothetical protein